MNDNRVPKTNALPGECAGIEGAAEHFRTLLRQQEERRKKISHPGEKKDFSSLDRITIGLIDGDGIGPIIMDSAKKALRALLSHEEKAGTVVFRRIEGMTIENRLRCGKTVPEESRKAIRECDVLLKGPTETPHGGSFESANVALRRELDLYANVRPARLPSAGIDWVFFRENSEGEYILGSKGLTLDGMAVDFKVITPEGTRRIAEEAFSYARRNGKKRVAVVTKANIMKKTDGLFSQIARETAANYPEIEVSDWYIDIMAANLVNPEMQSSFEVFLTPNLYGDILTDEAAQICGGVGTAGSANVGANYAMFEAIHGTAPRMIADGLGEYANPMSILRAAGMLLRHIGFSGKAELLDRALDNAAELCRVTGNRDGASCREFTDCLLSEIVRQSALR